jgi:Gpi18-like mannosyltransferase
MNKKLTFVVVGALILRLMLVFSAYHGDLNNNISWGTLAVERGLRDFYDPPSQSFGEVSWPYSAPNQPPLTILMFAGSRLVWQVIENVSWWLNNNFKIFPSPFIWFWESKGMILLIKLPSILADLGIGLLIYKYLIKKKKKLALSLTSIWLFNPVIWYNSSVWGQTDSIVNLLGLIAVVFLIDKDLIKFSAFYTLSLLFKGSLAIFGPILLVIAINQRRSIKSWLYASFCVLLTIIVVSIWFHPRLDFFTWLINLYKDRILPGEIGYLTANAFNFWWLVDPGKTLDSIIYFGLSARTWGITFLLIGIISIISWLRRRVNDKKIFISLILVSLISFLFMTRIHGRYMYPLFPYATILLGFVPLLVLPYIILIFTHFLNLYFLFWYPPFKSLELLFVHSSFMQVISVINILIFLYLFRQLASSEI